MTEYGQMQALARRATPQQWIDAAISLGHREERAKYRVQIDPGSWLHSSLGAFDVTHESSRFYIKDLYREALNAVRYGACTIAHQRGTREGSPERIAEDAICRKISAAFVQSGVDIHAANDDESGFAVCNAGFSMI